ncbi:MAG: hypothetical protein IJM90_01815 [Firmicutes bacterium]|nr:hypothetical protein [Bacillota bacterium]
MSRINRYAPIVHTGFANTYTDEQMHAFIKWCAEMGYSGFSAEGKAYPPTNDIEGWAAGFMHGLHTAAREAEEAGLDVWIFDEWGYPSGTAAGKTLEGHPEYRCKSLYLAADYFLQEGESVSISVPAHFVAASAWPVLRDAFARPSGEPVRVFPDGDGRLAYTASHRRERFCVVCYAYGAHQANSIYVPDPTDDRQSNLDTLSFQATRRYLDMMHERYAREMPELFGRSIRGFFYDEPFMLYPHPYTYDLPEEFLRTKHYDIMPRLAPMVAGVDKQAEHDWRDVCTTRMAEAFYGQLADWCHEHGLELVGHQDLDHDIRSLDTVSGNFFKNSMKNDSPGIDYIWDQLRPGHFADFPRYAGSAKHLGGKAHALSESFAATGQCMFPDYMRWAMEYQMIRGIDRFYLMIADPALDEKNFGSPISAWHPVSRTFGKLINERVARTNRLLSENALGTSAALYVPVGDISDAYPPVLPNRISLHMPWEWVNETAEAMAYAPYDYDYIWDEALLACEIRGGALITPSGQRLTAVVLPAVEKLDAAVARKLIDYHEAGGRILCVCTVPYELLGIAEIVTGPEDLPAVLSPEIGLSIPGRLTVAVRDSAEGRIWLVLNEDRFPYDGSVTIPGTGALAEYCHEEDAWYAVEDISHFEPMQLRIFRRGTSGRQPRRLACKSLPIRGWTVTTPDGELDLGEDLRDWRSFMDPSYTGFVTYRAAFEVPSDGLYRISLGQVCYSAVAEIDGAEYKVPFAPYQFDATLTKGVHQLVVRVLNTGVNRLLGSTEAERQCLERALAGNHRTYRPSRYVNDRRYVVSGLLGPVSLTPYEPDHQ